MKKILILLLLCLILLSACQKSPTLSNLNSTLTPSNSKFTPSYGCHPPNPPYTLDLLLLATNTRIINASVESDRNTLSKFFNDLSNKYDGIDNITMRDIVNYGQLSIYITYDTNVSEANKIKLINSLKNDISKQAYFSHVWLNRIDCTT